MLDEIMLDVDCMGSSSVVAIVASDSDTAIGQMLLDTTGADYCSISPSVQTKLELQPIRIQEIITADGEVHTYNIVLLKCIQIGQTPQKNIEALVMPTEYLYGKTAPTIGLLGRNFFSGLRSYAFKGNKLIIEAE